MEIKIETIVVTFPKGIPKEKVISILEGSLEKNSKYSCEVEFLRVQKDENVFIISSEDGPNAFYLIGMTAYGIIQAIGF